jgi:cellulose synthase/poly-beta-1,6-N-acetylglucosamine synthase-like glycosyltransferase
MTPWEIAFWICAAGVAYPYVLYPLLLALLARLRRRPLRPRGPPPRSVSVVVAAHNEERGIDRRLGELTHALDVAGLDGEVLVVSDGSTDGTAAVARAHTKGRVRVLELPERGGKALALTRACAEARHEIVVFADVRQAWAPDALELLLDNFRDPDVGAVSGDLVVTAQPGALEGVGLYWRHEKWLRRQESLVGSQVGVTGAISAVRRELFRPIPPGTLLDDVYWPLAVAMQRRRVVHDSRALAYDRLPDTTRDEFLRKVRTLTGNFQLAARLPAALLPWRNPVWFQFLSHKLLRLTAPWLLLALLVLSVRLPGWVGLAALSGQVLFYALGLLGLVPGVSARLRPAAAAASFLVLNSAAWVAFWVWALGRANGSWRRASYAAPKPAAAAGPVSAVAPRPPQETMV